MIHKGTQETGNVQERLLMGEVCYTFFFLTCLNFLRKKEKKGKYFINFKATGHMVSLKEG